MSNGFHPPGYGSLFFFSINTCFLVSSSIVFSALLCSWRSLLCVDCRVANLDLLKHDIKNGIVREMSQKRVLLLPQPWKLEQRNLCFPQPSTDFSSSVLACSILISARMLSTCSSNFLLLYTSSCFSVSSDGVAEFFLSRAWHLKRWIFHEEKPSFVTPVASAQIPKGLKIHSVLGLQDL